MHHIREIPASNGRGRRGYREAFTADAVAHHGIAALIRGQVRWAAVQLLSIEGPAMTFSSAA